MVDLPAYASRVQNPFLSTSYSLNLQYIFILFVVK